MGADTAIEWAHHTWNPWYGCSRVSEGCENCYALRRMTQLKLVKGPGDIRRASKAVWRFPLSKKVKAGDRVFVCSWGDFFHSDSLRWVSEAYQVMAARPDVTFLLLTKRPNMMYEVCGGIRAAGRALSNVWLGFTAENQRRFDERWPVFDSIEWPGKKFVSLEPMLGPIVLPAGFGRHKVSIDVQTMLALEDSRRVLDGVIAGGESGPNARPMHPKWARGVRDQCVEAGVPFFFKQWGEWVPTSCLVVAPDRAQPKPYPALGSLRCLYDFDSASAGISGRGPLLFVGRAPEDMRFARVGKKKAGRLLDGRTWDEVPV